MSICSRTRSMTYGLGRTSSMMNHQQPSPTPFCAVYAPLLSLLSLGELEPDQIPEVQEHLATCEYCQAELRAYEAVQAALRAQFGSKDDDLEAFPSIDRA